MCSVFVCKEIFLLFDKNLSRSCFGDSIPEDVPPAPFLSLYSADISRVHLGGKGMVPQNSHLRIMYAPVCTILILSALSTLGVVARAALLLVAICWIGLK